jgi:hypothetical protein
LSLNCCFPIASPQQNRPGITPGAGRGIASGQAARRIAGSQKRLCGLEAMDMVYADFYCTFDRGVILSLQRKIYTGKEANERCNDGRFRQLLIGSAQLRAS